MVSLAPLLTAVNYWCIFVQSFAIWIS